MPTEKELIGPDGEEYIMIEAEDGIVLVPQKKPPGCPLLILIIVLCVAAIIS